MTTRRPAFWVFSVLAILVACNSGHVTPAPRGGGVGATPPATKITHIVFVVQENRTFDNIFGGPKPFPGASAASTGETSNGNTIPLNEVPLEGGDDPNNYHQAWLDACAPTNGPPFTVGQPAPCTMNGFDVAASPAPGYTPPASTSSIYSYVEYNETAPYFAIAKAYTLGDHFFMGHNSESYTAHQYIFSTQSNNVVDEPAFPSTTSCGIYYDYCAFTPWGCDSPSGTTTYILDPTTGIESAKPTGPPPCFGQSYRSLADLVGSNSLTWRVYAHSLCSNILGLDVNRTIRYGGLWPSKPNMQTCHTSEGANSTPVDTPNFRMPEDTFLSDVKAGVPLANVTWILPGPVTSDHPGVPLGYCGPWWVANIVDAIGTSPDWNSTAIFIFWDDWGGFYDHVPPYVVRDQEGPGFRVPLLVVSPYAKRGYVSHTNTEFATLARFVETTFNLGFLGGAATDSSPYLDNFNDVFDFSTSQPFTKIPIPSFAFCNLPASRQRHEVRGRSRWLRLDGDD